MCYAFRLSTGKKDLQKLEENYKEYTVITTWIISNEKRLKELKDDTSGGDEGLKRRRVIILVRKMIRLSSNLFDCLSERPQLVNKICQHCLFPVDKYGTSCYHLVARLMRPTDSQQVVPTILISSARNKLLTS